ncbi:MAG TPA: hypothetical protein VGS22_25920 [Thermoanaerobaculia bacterium]|jgi:hypothetical protein|nr:hypothetical protein [Thermoanaerobaculia bacterium]
MSSFTLKLNMHGLCFYVPDDDGKAMRVLLVDPPQPAPAALPNGHHDHAASASLSAPHVHEVHEPLLVVNELDLHPKSPRVPDFQYSDGNRLAAFRLRDLEFSVVNPKARTLAVLDYETETCPTADNLESFGWVVPLGRIDGGLGQLDPRCLSSRNIHPSVAARVHLNEGTLGTFSFSSPASRPAAVWEFVSSDGIKADHRQAIADVVQLQLLVTTPSITFTFNPLRDGFGVPDLKLRPRGDEDEITVFIKCMPIEDVLGFRPPQELIPGESRSRDRHFTHFFDLFQSQAARQLTYAPQLALQSCSPGVVPPTIGQVHCPGGKA